MFRQEPQPPVKGKKRWRRVPCSTLAWACGVLPTALWFVRLRLAGREHQIHWFSWPCYPSIQTVRVLVLGSKTLLQTHSCAILSCRWDKESTSSYNRNMKKILLALKPYLLKLLILPPIIVGVVILVIAVRNRVTPEKVPESELARTLRVITVEQMDFQPRAIGYGTARPAQVWQAIAEVKGRVVKLHSDLKSGSFVQKDSLLVLVDDTDTKLAISRLDADIAKADSSISELNANRTNFEASVELERQALKVAEDELTRNERLLDSNAGSQAEVDSQRRAVIAQRQKVQSIVNSLNLMPSQLQAAKANLAVSNANLAEKKRDLDRIEIRAPFDCRIGPVKLELNQFLSAGSTLFEAQAISAVEIEAQVAVKNMRLLFNEKLREQDLRSGQTEMNQNAVKRYFDLDVIVSYSAGSERAERKATFERLREELDSQTRSLGVIVAIKDPFKSLLNGPPPASGTYCEVELRGKLLKNQIVVPRSAIHTEHVYVLDKENRLRRRKVKIEATQSEFAVIETGLEVDDILVVSDPTPAVEGMLVTPVEDDELLKLIKTQAAGEVTLK